MDRRALLALACSGWALASVARAASPRLETVEIVSSRGRARFQVEIAATRAEQARGLMFRKSLAPDRGMLFIYKRPQPAAYWMKNTLIPLDILYFDANRRLVSVQWDVPPCKADPCPLYPSHMPARYVLEIPAGTTRRIGVKMGDELKIAGDVGAVH